MKINLTRPLIIFDLETTGLDTAKDHIIQISYIKVEPDGNEIRQNYFVNPGMPIPPAVVELTGITDEMVKDAPGFKELAPALVSEFEGCDFAGFNSNRFDVPFLAEEFLRNGVNFDFSKCRLIDVQNIYHKMERRNLAAAYKFYTGRKMEDDFQAHLADQDTEATYRVLQGELDMYAPGKQEDEGRELVNDVDFLADFSKMSDNIDFAGRMVWKPVLDSDGNVKKDQNGKEIKKAYFNFGKYKDEPVYNVIKRDPGWISWVLTSDFPAETKQWIQRFQLMAKNS